MPSAAPIPLTGGVSPATATVNEAALDTVTDPGDLGHGSVTGSNPSSTAETTTGTLTFSDPDVPVTVTGVAAGNSGGLPVSGNVSTTITGTYGLLQVDAAGHYTYTLTTPYTTSPPANNGPETEPGKDVFSFTVTDAFGNTNTSTISISIIDDVPTAHVDFNSAEAGQTVTGNVETNDTAGADGIASIAWTGAVGSTVTGAHGVLTVTADGTYSYHANVNTSGTDVFNYTITDGDGDTSPSTLTIDVTNGQPSVSPATATVNEAALDTVTDPGDLGHGSVTGSNPSSTAETTTGTLTFSDPDVPVTVTGVAAGNSGGLPVSGNVSTTITGTYGLLQVDAAGHYTYTLTTPYTTSPPANNGPETEPGKDVFSFTVTDAFGNTNTSTISISIIDDVPTAHVDFNSAESDQTVTGNVETNDTAGADGIASIAWTGAVGSTVTGAHGVLTVTADGTYSYHANASTSGTDVFNYTITDGDGDTSPSTLTINVTNGQPSVSPATATVNEAALDTVTDRRRPRPRLGDGLEPELDGGDDDGDADVLGSGRPGDGDGGCGGQQRRVAGQRQRIDDDYGHVWPVPGRRCRPLHLHADDAVYDLAACEQRGGDRAWQGRVQLYGDGRVRQHQHLDHLDLDHRRRADGACGLQFGGVRPDGHGQRRDQ